MTAPALFISRLITARPRHSATSLAPALGAARHCSAPSPCQKPALAERLGGAGEEKTLLILAPEVRYQ